ncbi:MAG TPA: hypothetical protein VGP70_20930 [Actinomadura sp.]|nr:hypothetical protein [Actinomadura sp.]
MHDSSGAAGSSGHEKPDRRPATVEMPLPEKPSPPEPGPEDEPEPVTTAEQEAEPEPALTAEQETGDEPVTTAEQDTAGRQVPADESGPAGDPGTSGPDDTGDEPGATEGPEPAERHGIPWYRTAGEHGTSEPRKATDRHAADRHDAEEEDRGATKTRLDLPLPARTARNSPAPGPAPSPTAPHDSQPPPDPRTGPGPQSPPATREPLHSPWPQVPPAPHGPPAPPTLGPVSSQPGSGPASERHTWHPFHSLIGVFLVTYGVTGALATIVGRAGHQQEIADYLAKTIGAGAAAATALLVAAKAVEILLTITALTGMLRRADVWLLPALFGWTAGFGVFCVLDLWGGFMGRLAEHVLFLLVFTALLYGSYVLSRKARARPPAQPMGGTYGLHAPGGLTRT